MRYVYKYNQYKHDYHILWYIIYKIFMLSNTYINICCAFINIYKYYLSQKDNIL